MKARRKSASKVGLPALTFKAHEPDQAVLFPPSLGDLIEANHPVRVVRDIVDRLDLSLLTKNYKGGGRASYHPKMLLKVLVYGYLCNIYSSRRMEVALKENVPMMWLSGNQQPDHNTINRFRSERLKGVIKEVFARVVGLLIESKQVSIKEVYVDGTTIEANANRYTFVWGKAIETSRARIAVQLEELWNYAESVAKEELKDKRPESFAPVDPEQVRKTIEDIHQALDTVKKKVPAKTRQRLKHARKEWPAKTAEYNQKEAILAGRNSYSKTDHDATFMHLKEDHRRNGQCKPGYNLQASTNGQFIVNYSVHQTSADTTTFPSHFAQYQQLHGQNPKEVVADGGYGSEENYTLLEDNNIAAYVKYNIFDAQQQSPSKLSPFRGDLFPYDPKTDTLTCPAGKPMHKTGTSNQKSSTGFQQQVTHYQATGCSDCPLHDACHKKEGDRIVELNHNAQRLRRQAAALLNTEQGIAHRKKRPWDVESVFGNIKHNKGFRRFLLRGKTKVEIEAGLLAIAHNIQKIAS